MEETPTCSSTVGTSSTIGKTTLKLFEITGEHVAHMHVQQAVHGACSSEDTWRVASGHRQILPILSKTRTVAVVYPFPTCLGQRAKCVATASRS